MILLKLNSDCVRDLLLYLEENLNFNNMVTINTLKLSNYSSDDLIYTSQKLIEADFIECTISKVINSRYPIIKVKSITYNGHQFLDSIRDNSIWKDAKNKASKLASVSLPILQQLAASLIKSSLGLS